MRPSTREGQGQGPSLVVTWLYGVGEIPNAVKTVVFGLFTLFYYTTVLGLSGTLVGVAAGIGLLWDALIDPYVGHASDGARSRFGRRHPFMFAGALTMGATFWLFFNPPAGLGTGGLFAWLIVTGLLVRTASSVYAIPYFALGAELTRDYRGRTTVTAIRGFLALVGTMGAASLSFLLFFPDTGSGGDPKLNPAGYPFMGAVFGTSMTVLGLCAVFGTLGRGAEKLQDTRPPARQSFLTDFAQSFANRSFRALFIACSLFFLAVVVNGSLSIHYLTYYLKVTSSGALSGFQATFYVSAAVGVLIWLRVSRVVEKNHLCLTALLGVMAIMAASVILVGPGSPLGVGNVPAVLVGHAIAGFFGSVLWFVPGSMIADIADEDELATGRRREASFFGVFYFGQQLAAGMSVVLTGMLLDRFAGFVPGKAEQSPETISRLGTLFGLLPAALLVLAVAALLRYTLTRRRVADVQDALRQTRGAMTSDGSVAETELHTTTSSDFVAAHAVRD